MQPTHSSRRILLPVKTWFIVLSLLLALLLNMIPLGRLPGVPDWLALVLAFWCVREPLKVGMAVGMVMGLLMDIINGAAMGQHAMAYVLLAFGATQLSRRILWFGLLQQSLHIFPLLLMVQVVMVLIRMLVGAGFPGWLHFSSSLIGMLLWTPLNYVLLLPQLRPVERDDNRPI